jgi:hypothetical protein
VPQPHVRPYWAIWNERQLVFSTASRTLRNISANQHVTVHLESGIDVVIVEGTARAESEPSSLATFVDSYNEKYDWDLTVRRDGGVSDSSGNAGSVIAVSPRTVFAWPGDLESATRWRFEPEDVSRI